VIYSIRVASREQSIGGTVDETCNSLGVFRCFFFCFENSDGSMGLPTVVCMLSGALHFSFWFSKALELDS